MYLEVLKNRQKKSSNIIFNHPLQSLVSGASVVEDCEGCLLGHEGCFPFYSKVLFFVCGSATLSGALAMLTLVPFEIGRRSFKKDRKKIVTISLTTVVE